MTAIPTELERRIAALATDREAGASEILARVIGVLRAARSSHVSLTPVARAVCRAQPSMASVWNAALEAIASEGDPVRFERFAQRVARGPDTLARFARQCFSVDAGPSPLRLVTISSSRSVLTVVNAIRPVRDVRVLCSESRPALEGRALAARLASQGIPVTCFSDAAIGHALPGADAVLVGADAIGPEWFLNKSGTRMLAAAAQLHGIPVYVAATRDKFVSQSVGARLVIREGAAAEIWDAPPAGVEVRNPYFESTPLDLVTMIISDVGLLGAGMVPDLCKSIHDPAALAALDEVGR